MKTLIVDMSPIFYRWAFSTTTEASKTLNVGDDGLYNFDEYKDIFIYKVLDYIAKFKYKFEYDELVLAIDAKPYWREKLWSGYKYGRQTEDKSGIDWKKVKQTQSEIVELLRNHSSFKIIKLKGAEGDDVGFVLSEELSKRGHEVIIKSLDHDWIYNLVHPNVKYWETKHNVKDKQCGWVEFNEAEIENLKFEHCMFGDRGDYLFPVVYYSQFSDEFKAMYPDVTELKAYPKRHEIDLAFRKKTGKSAYKHPRMGAKTFKKKMEKEGFTIDEFLSRNPIYKLNYELNKKLALPSGIPDEIKQAIINEYDNASSKKNEQALIDYFMKYGAVDLIGLLPLF